MRRAALFLPLLLLFLMGYANALQVTVNPSPITGTVTKSDPVKTFSATITLEANDSAAVVYVSPVGTVAISGPTYVTSSGTYTYKLVFPDQPGTYTGTVIIRATGTDSTYQVSYNVTVSAWEEKYRDYFEKGVMYTVKVGNKDYLMKVKDIQNNTISLYFDGTIYTMAEGDEETVNDNLKIKVDTIFTDGVVLKLYTTGDDVSVQKYSATESEGTPGASLSEQDLSGFHFLITKYSKYIQQGMTYTITVTLVNDTDYRVYLKDVYFENTTVTDEGEKPTRLEDYQLPSYLDPGQELTLKVTIDTRGLEVGKTYTPTLVALGRVGNQDVRAQIDFYITVVKAVQTGNTQTQNNTSNTNSNTGSTSHTAPKLRTMTIEVMPPNPQPGDLVTIYVKDTKTGDYVNADITVNGTKESSFTADWCKTYRIVAMAQGYVSATKTITTKCKTLQVSISPQNPQEGDTVTIMVTDQETGEPVNAVIKVDGRPIAGTTWTAKAGTHVISVSAEGYRPKSITVNVRAKPAQPTEPIPKEVNQGETVTIHLSKPASWEVYDQNNVLVASDQSDTISFEAAEPGTYTIKLEGRDIGSLRVLPVNTGGNVSVNFSDYAWVLAALAVVFILYDFAKRKKKAKKSGEPPVGFDLRPKFALPMGEGEQGGGTG